MKHLAHTLLATGLALAAMVPAACTRNSAVPRTWQGTTSSEPSADLPPGSLLVIPNERFTFKMSMLGFDAGELVMAAGEPGEVEGHDIVFFRSRAVSTGIVGLLKTVTDEVTTWIDVDTGKPTYHRTDTTIGSKDTEGVEIRFAAKQFDVLEWENGKKQRKTQVLPTEVPAYDLTSAMMSLRGWKGAKGDRATLHVLRSTLFWQTHVEYAGPDSVKTKLGRFAAVRVDGVSRRIQRNGELEPDKEARYFSMWFTDDDLRLPILIAAKTDYGDIRMELVEYAGAGREVAAR